MQRSYVQLTASENWLLVEQWTGNPEAGDSSTLSNH